MRYTKNASSQEKRDKRFRFSIRKFNVGVASVAVAAFWMVSGGTVAANETSVSEATAVVVTAPAALGNATELAIASEVAQPTEEEQSATEVQAQSATEDQAQPMTEATTAIELTEVAPQVEVPVTEAPATQVAPSVPAGPTRTAATTYRVQYVNEETGLVEKQENYSVAEQTTAEIHTFRVAVKLSAPTGFVPVSAANAAGQEFAIVNNAIEAAIVEKNSSSRTILVTVRQDDVAANSNDEGYAALRATTNPSTSPTTNIATPDPKKAVASDYAISGAWTVSNPLPSERDDKNTVTAPTNWNTIYSEATATIPRENSTTVTATVRVYDLENQTAANANRVQIQENANMLSENGVGNNAQLFELMTDPNVVPALDIRVRPNRLIEGENANDKFNFSGEYDSGYITITFSEEVINPIIDLAGIGGSAVGAGLDRGDGIRFIRGSFNATAWEYQGTETLELSKNASNLQINGNRIEVIDRNTTANYVTALTRVGTATNNVGNIGTSSGNGSVKIVGKVKELTFKLIHQTTPLSEFANLEGADREKLLRDGKSYADGINGLDRDMNDDGFYFTYSDGSASQLPNINADLQRMSLRLPTGYVLVNYVDTEGKVLQTQYTDVNKGTAEGTSYNTAEDKTEKPDTIGSGNETYYLVPAGNYTVGTVGENSELTETTTELGTDAVAGETILGKKEITYVYQKGGDVKVHYFAIDENGNKTPLSGTATGAAKATVGTTEEDTAYSKPGTAYNTSEDLKPATITDDQGNVWTLVAEETDGYNEKDGQSEVPSKTFPETGEVEAATTKHINYYYKKVEAPKGSVVINYVDIDGNKIAESKEDLKDQPVDTAYNTTEGEEKPATLPGQDGKDYFLTEKTEMTDGTKIVDGVKQVESTEGTGADTVKNTATTNGDAAKVVEGTTHVTYVYEKGGDVVVNYFQVDEQGNRTEIKLSGTAEGAGKATVAEREEDTAYSKPGTEYNTSADLKPTTITDANGDKWELVSTLTDGDAEEGTVEAGKTKEINYYYKKVEAPKGSVVINYVDIDGNKIAESKEDLKDQPVDTAYNTTEGEEKPATLPGQDGKDYFLTEKTEMTDGTKIVDGVKQVESTEGTGADTVKNTATTNGDAAKVVEGTTHVTYVYEKGGDVVVNYFQVDEQGNRTEIKLSGTAEGAGKATVAEREEDTAYSKPGTEYNTSADLKPTTITDANGDKWELVSTLTDGDAEEGTVEAGKTKEINYYYKKVEAPKGSVVINYVDIDGNKIAESKEDLKDQPVDTAYNTTEGEEKPATLPGQDGKDYFLTEKTEMTDGTKIVDGVKQVESTEGTGADTVKNTATTNGDAAKVVEGTTHVTYVYEKGGDVVVNYFQVDEQGNRTEIKLSGTAEGAGKATVAEREEDTAYSKPGTEYNTSADLKPTTITDANGDKWELVSNLTDGAPEEGTVEAGTTKEINYYYKKVEAPKGSVVINYVDIDGNKIAEPKEDLKDQPVDTAYNTTEGEEKPATLPGQDGKDYFLTEKTEMTDGTKIVDGVKQVESTEGTGADTVKNTATTNGDAAKVVEGTTHVTYVYEKGGDVVVNYFQVDEQGNRTEIKLSGTAEGAGKATVAEREEDTAYSKPGTEYNTSADLKPTTITDTNGDKWELVSNLTDGDAEEGTVEAGTTKEINYYYKKVPKTGDVEVHYHIVDKDGNVLTQDAVDKVTDTKDGKAGDTYNTADHKPAEITVGGKTYVLVEGIDPLQGDSEGGSVVAGDTKVVNYYYVEKVAEAPTTGDVVVHYHIVDKDGNVLTQDAVEKVTDTKDGKSGDTYNTADHKPAEITVGGKTYVLVEDIDPLKGDSEGGSVVAGEVKVVNYYYVEKVVEAPKTGDVEVHYHIVDKDGNVLTQDAVEKVTDTKDGKSGDTYNTADHKPAEITVGGKTYVLVEDIDPLKGDSEGGSVVAGEVKVVNYYYVEKVVEAPKTGDVEVHYHIVDKDGNVLTQDAVEKVTDTKDGKSGDTYNTADHKPAEITVGGKTYVLVEDIAPLKGDSEGGSVVAGEVKVVNYYYVEKVVEAPKTGDVEVHYHIVDKDGNVLTQDAVEKVTDTKDGKSGDTYNTADHKPAEITVGGKTYVLVEGIDPLKGDSEGGSVVAGEVKVVNYYYVEKVVEAPKTGDVEVHYHIVDKDGNVLTQDAVEKVTDTKDGKSGDTYNTADHKPAEITVGGKTYVLVEGIDPLKGDSEGGSVVAGEVKVVNYYYVEKVVEAPKTGDVEVHYHIVDKDGNVLTQDAVEKVTDTKDGKSGDTYNTADHKPAEITVGGKTYVLVEGIDPLKGDSEGGSVVAGEVKVVNYYYVEKVVEAPKTGDVEVHYHIVDKDGNVLTQDAVDKVTDTKDGKAGDTYNTADHKPAEITVGGKTYVLVEGIDPLQGDSEGGSVVEGDTKVVNYYYVEKVAEAPTTGDVVVHYHIVDKDGNVLTQDAVEKVTDTKDGKSGDTYNTADHKPAEITVGGKTYVLVEDIDPLKGDSEGGSVVAGEVKVVNYYYVEKVVEAPKAGDVEVHYHIVDKDGNVLTQDAVEKVTDTKDGKSGDTYNTADHKPAEITVGGKTYVLVEDIDPLKGDSEGGSVVAGEVKVVNYYYVEKVVEAPKTGDVEVHYHIVDKDGNVLTQDAVEKVTDTKDGKSGDTYNTADHKPAEITVGGKTYVLVEGIDPLKGDSEGGSVVAGEVKVVNYYYVEKVVEAPKTGDVEVHYHIVDKDGNVLTQDAVEKVTDTKDGKSGDTYNTADHKPAEITVGGKTYVLVEDIDPLKGDSEGGSVVAGEVKVVNYYYVEKVVEAPKTGDVEVHYHIVDKDGNVLTQDAVEKVTDTKDGKSGDTYNTADHKPAEITVGGKTYVLVEDIDPLKGDSEGGSVVAGEVKVVNYYYVEKVVEAPKTADVEVHYHIVDKDGNVLTQDAVEKVTDTKDGKSGDTYNTADHKPAEITVGGKTYVLVEGIDPLKGDSEGGSVVAGDTKVVNYYYVEKVTEEPVVKTGEVVARYVIEGTETELKDPSTVKGSTTPVDEPYGDTPPAIIVKDGKVYELVRTRTNEGDAPSNGTVVEGKQTITYEYKVKETPVVKTGEVVARYVIEGTETELKDPSIVKGSTTPVDESYGDTPPAIIEKDGKVYELVRTRTNEGDAPSNGTVVEGKQTITYEYKLKEKSQPTSPVTPAVPSVPGTEKPTDELTPKPVQSARPVGSVTSDSMTTVTPAQSTLPNTGDHSSVAASIGSGLLLIAAGLVTRRRKED